VPLLKQAAEKRKERAPAKAEATTGEVPKAIPVVGCKDTKMFHMPDCKWVKEIEKAGTKVDFPSKSAAKKAGMKPCGDCMPAKPKAK
jgi:methylphosphotriester-DNA--protein-cysteine methyltransferase